MEMVIGNVLLTLMLSNFASLVGSLSEMANTGMNETITDDVDKKI